MKTKTFTCIVCPLGCQLSSDSKGTISGFSCPRGLAYAKSEILSPMRMVTTTVTTDSSIHPVVSVKTSSAVPKELVLSVIEAIKKIHISTSHKIGSTIIKNVLGLGVDVVLTRDIFID